MEILLIIMIVGFLIYATAGSRKAAESVPEECKPHRWEYRKQPDTPDEYLVCSKCNKNPTQLLEEV